jgi:hypothetical protein
MPPIALLLRVEDTLFLPIRIKCRLALPYPKHKVREPAKLQLVRSGSAWPHQSGRAAQRAVAWGATARAPVCLVRGYATFNVDGVGPILPEIKGEAALAVGSEPGRPAEG